MAHRQPLSIQIPESLARKIRSLSASHGQSADEWTVSVLQAAVERELRERPAEAGVQEYVPGRALNLDEMLAMADDYAEGETSDAIETRYLPAHDK
ncbi:MAG: hypothetical protein HY319_15195 [Armatimonadetes bacterium]|nr:hypothetical protein [Armatimonadota bacterium]